LRRNVDEKHTATLPVDQRVQSNLQLLNGFIDVRESIQEVMQII
jgi:hypothetical protein